MPLFAFKCMECNFSKEHFMYANSEKVMPCPKCGAGSYTKEPSRFSIQMEYNDNAEYVEKKIDPMVNEIYEKIGKEAANEDTKTLENLYGSEVVESSINKYDE